MPVEFGFKTIAWKTILMRSFWYQKFEDPTIHVTVATFPKFLGLKFQNGFTHAKLRGRDPIFRYCPIIQTCSYTWASQNKFSTTPCKSPVLFRPSAITFGITFWTPNVFKLTAIQNVCQNWTIEKVNDLRNWTELKWKSGRSKGR